MASSSVMVAVTVWVPFSVPFVTLVISVIMVSLSSSSASLTPVNVVVLLNEPAFTVMDDEPAV